MGLTEEIVIAGISGRFPECDNVEQFKEALLTGRDLITVNETRFSTAVKGIPHRTGKVPKLDKFDASFFGLHVRQVNHMDPRQRILLEATFEAIIDAGYNPCELRGSNTGVFVGTNSLNEKKTPEDTNCYYYIVNSPHHAANIISYCFDFKGPSFAVDTACSSALQALTLAYEKLKSGEIENAIVGGSHINFHPEAAQQLNKLGVLSADGSCKVFQKNRNGFAKSEAVCSIFLKRASDSRRIYATILGAKSNVDGYKKTGIVQPSGEMQAKLIKELYDETKVCADEVVYIEMHGTGTITGDQVETQALEFIFGGNKKEPLLVGSVKSNMGHAESASGLAGLTKLIIAMESGIIPATLNTTPIDTSLTAISNGTLQPVTINTALKDGLVGVSSFGITGSNAHTILKPIAHKKVREVEHRRHRLVQISGRTEAVKSALDEIQRMPADEECLSLLDEIHKNNIEGHDYRGYIILGEDPVQEIAKQTFEKRPIWFIFSGFGSQWPGMAKDLMHIEVFKKTFDRCAKALKSYGVDLENIINDESPSSLESAVNCFSAITAVTVALTDLLTSLSIMPDFMAGHSLGEVGCAYANGDITAEQAVLLAYGRGYATTQTTLPAGLMAAIGLSKDALREVMPDDIYIACFNSQDNNTIAGPAKSVTDFVQRLSENGVFTKLVNTANVAFHSPYLKDADKYFLDFARKVLTDPKPRSDKWISTSVPPEKSDETWAKYNSAEYHVYNYKNPVLFDNIYKHIQKNAVIIEISPHGILQAILRRQITGENSLISLMNRTVNNQEQHLLGSIGKIFNAGGQPNLRNLYKEVDFPVKRGTKMLAPLIKWNHDTSWFVPIWTNQDYFGKAVTVNLSDAKYSHFSGHNINGRILIPATGYLELVWRVLADMNLKDINELPVIFEEVEFLRSIVLLENKDIKLIVNIMKKSGKFEIVDGLSLVVTGKIRKAEDVTKKFTSNLLSNKNMLRTSSNSTIKSINNDSILKKEDIYKELHLRRYKYEGLFQGISEYNYKSMEAKIVWNNSFACFLDCMLQLLVVEQKTRDLAVPTGIKKVIIDPAVHLDSVQNNCVNVIRNSYHNIIQSKGIEIYYPKVSVIRSQAKIQSDPFLEEINFVYYNSPINSKYDFQTSLIISLNIISQNTSGFRKKLNIGQIENKDKVNNEDLSKDIKDLCNKNKLTATDYLIIKPNTFDTIMLNVLIVDAETSEECKEHIKKIINCDMFILYIGNFAGKKFDNLDMVFQTPTLSLLRIKQDCVKYDDLIQVNNSDFKWLDQLKKAVVNENTKNILLYSQDEHTSGISGLVAGLQAEDIKMNFRSVFIDQDSPPFTVNDQFYQKQLSKNLAFNVLRNNNWGTFISIPLEEVTATICKNASLSVKTRGSISTVYWIETPALSAKESADAAINVHFVGLNFRDTLLALGKISSNNSSDLSLGFEYSGISQSGKRVMGLITDKSQLQTKRHPRFAWEVPKSWSLKQAATVPVAYITCYYGLVLRGHMEQNESILIHAGSGAVGIAAIRIALSLKARIFTTVSTEEKKLFLMNLFPQLEEENIGNSRDTSFYGMIKTRTEGKGVDIVLNSLAGELFQVSINCLAHKGRFLEIGKVDLINGSFIDPGIFLKNCSFHGIMIDEIVNNESLGIKIRNLITEGITSGVIQPIPHRVFQVENIGKALKFLSLAKHTGKVLVQIKNETLKPNSNIMAYPKIFFDPEKVYIIIGGLGGMGLELAHWLFSKGARKVVLNSRRNIWNGYQSLCMDTWSKLKYIIVIDLNDTTKMAGAQKLIMDAQKFGHIGGIFNTALVLRDAFIMDQTSTNFEEVFKPKVTASENIDVITRSQCPHLDHFVLFSSMAASKGFFGQTNYCMANSALERLCEKRRKDQLPGLAVEWGPVADVGVLTSEKFINTRFLNIEHQKIESCWEALEKFMIKKVIVGISIVYADHSTNSKVEKTTVDTIAEILGIENIENIDKARPFSHFGLDSMMVSEIKQIIYQEYQQDIEAESINELTFGYILNLEKTKSSNTQVNERKK